MITILLAVPYAKIVALGDDAPAYIAGSLMQKIERYDVQGQRIAAIDVTWKMLGGTWQFIANPVYRPADDVPSPRVLTADDFPLADLIAT